MPEGPMSPPKSKVPVIRYYPGPWREEIVRDNKSVFRYIIADETFIAQVESETASRRHGYRAPDLSAEANAYLIAAAPELFESLQGLVRAIEDYIPALKQLKLSDGITASGVAGEYLCAKEAIAKAKGE